MKSQQKKQLKSQSKSRSQKGAGSSDYASLYHAVGVQPDQLSRFTLSNINKSPMFNPLQENTIIPTGTSGIIPTGSYYNSLSHRPLTNSLGPPTPGKIQMGGKRLAKKKTAKKATGPALYTTKTGKAITNPWIAHVYKFAEANGIKYSSAMKDPSVKNGYTKTTSKKA